MVLGFLPTETAAGLITVTTVLACAVAAIEPKRAIALNSLVNFMVFPY